MVCTPDKKIYGIVPSFNTHYLHVIDQPDLPGDSCQVIQHAIYLPTDNFGTIPNVPYFRLYASDIPCDSMVNTTRPAPVHKSAGITVWPVPAADVLYFSADGGLESALDLQIFDAFGRLALYRRELRLHPAASVPLEGLPAGAYFYVLRDNTGKKIKSGRVVKTRV